MTWHRLGSLVVIWALAYKLWRRSFQPTHNQLTNHSYSSSSTLQTLPALHTSPPHTIVLTNLLDHHKNLTNPTSNLRHPSYPRSSDSSPVPSFALALPPSPPHPSPTALVTISRAPLPYLQAHPGIAAPFHSIRSHRSLRRVESRLGNAPNILPYYDTLYPRHPFPASYSGTTSPQNQHLQHQRDCFNKIEAGWKTISAIARRSAALAAVGAANGEGGEPANHPQEGRPPLY